MIRQTPILGGYYQSRSLLLNAQRCVNLFVELVETRDGKMPGMLVGAPGMRLAREAPPATWRELHTMGNGAMFGVLGENVYQISAGYTLVPVGVLQTKSGPLDIVDNGRQLFMVDGLHAYCYGIADADFRIVELPYDGSAPTAATYQDGFFFINERDTNRWWQSKNGDGFTWNDEWLASSVKDGAPDPIVALAQTKREIWVIGSHTTEVWINAGTPGFAFGRLQGVFVQQGCAAPHSVALAGQSVIWLSRSMQGEGMVLMTQGYEAQRISTHAIEYAIGYYQRIDDAIAHTYENEGHLFYVLTFPSADATWSYDVSTKLWNELASLRGGQLHRHRANCIAAFGRDIVVGDFENGRLCVLDLDEYTDCGEKRKWLRSWAQQGPGQIMHRNDRYNELQVYMESGVGREPPDQVRALQHTEFVRTLDDPHYVRVLSGTTTPETFNVENPQVMLRWSDSGGRSWSNEHWTSVGKVGEVKKRVRWLRLGDSYDRVWEISATDPFKTAIIGAVVDVTPGT